MHSYDQFGGIRSVPRKLLIEYDGSTFFSAFISSLAFNSSGHVQGCFLHFFMNRIDSFRKSGPLNHVSAVVRSRPEHPRDGKSALFKLPVKCLHSNLLVKLSDFVHSILYIGLPYFITTDPA